MSENYSLQDLFKSGLTREQFIQKYSELKNTDGTKASSVFGNGMEGALGEMFDTINTDGNDTIDENEISLLMAYSDDGDNNSIVSENDLKVLYNKVAENIKSKYTSTNPQEMYNTAMQNSDILSNTYIQNLAEQIEILNELISSRQINSSNLINSFQSRIDNLVLKSTKLSTDFKKKYKEASDKAAKLQREYDTQTGTVQEKSQQIQSANAEAEIIKHEISGLDPEKDKDEISLRQKELDGLMQRQNSYSEDYSSLLLNQSSCAKELSTARGTLKKLAEEAKNQDSSIKSQIQNYQNNIETEKLLAETEIKGYKSQLAILQAAHAFAIANIPKQTSERSVDTSSFHKNDNLMSFDELSKEGLKYSSENGQKLACQIRSKVVGFTGYCSRHVANGLAATGLGNERTASACLMDDELRNNKNFREVKITSQDQLKNLPAGCVVVYEAGAAGYNAKHGHIEVTLGDGTAASDGITRNMRYSGNMSVFVPVENA
ncbi:MAG: hypothetical protein LUB59_07555 [Candidatus Gastranaerophilales bacterium]|nr:hypothetical protein [Candidatus Gastranaerophilales bacterium]